MTVVGRIRVTHGGRKTKDWAMKKHERRNNNSHDSAGGSVGEASKEAWERMERKWGRKGEKTGGRSRLKRRGN